MAARTFSLVTAMGLAAAFSAHADSGDIVDQVLQKRPSQPASSNTASLTIPSSASASVTLDSSDTVAQAPVPLAPPPGGSAAAGPTPAPPVGNGDIVDQVLSTLPPGPAGSPPPNQAAPTPVSAAVAPGGGDVIDQAPEPTPALSGATVPWTGLYVGVNLGGGTTHGGSGVTCSNSVTNSVSGCDDINNGGFNTSGVLGGGQLGYMTPLTVIPGLPLMFGAEIDVQGTGISASQNVSGPFQIAGFPDICSQCNYTASQSLDWFGTLRGRIGVPLDNVLVYGTGGIMVGGVSASQNLSFGGSPGYIVNAKSTLSGPTVGGGVEVLLPGLPISVKLEGLYYDLGTLRTATSPQIGFAANFTESKSFGFRGEIVRLGVNLRLGGLGAF